MHLFFIFLLFFNTGTGGINKFLGFLIMLVFQSRISNQLFVLFVVNARNRRTLLNDSELELFITQSSFSGSTSIELSESFESLFAGVENEKAVDKFNLRTEGIIY